MTIIISNGLSLLGLIRSRVFFTSSKVGLLRGEWAQHLAINYTHNCTHNSTPGRITSSSLHQDIHENKDRRARNWSDRTSQLLASDSSPRQTCPTEEGQKTTLIQTIGYIWYDHTHVAEVHSCGNFHKYDTKTVHRCECM